MKKLKKLVFSAILLSFAQTCYAADLGAIPALPAGAGAINNHDMMMLKQQQQLINEYKDFKNYTDRKNKKNKNKDLIENNTGEKIYDAETSQKLEEEMKEFQVSRKKKIIKRKGKTTTELEPAEEVIIETDPGDTLLKGETQKTDIADKVYIRGVGVTNSKILSDLEIQKLTDSVIGKYVSFEELEYLTQKFNYLYASKGYITARAFLPPQTILDGIVRINLVEGLVGNITVENNRWTSDSYITKRITAKKDDTFDVVELEKDIVSFNKYNPGVQLKATLNKGEVNGTTDIEIKTEENFPFHVTALMDNAGRYTIGELRGGLMLFADSLFKQRDRLSLGSYASAHSVTPFADYNIPVNKYDGRVGFMFSSSYAEVAKGPYRIFDIKSRSFNYSLYYTQPIIRKPNFELNAYTAINYKQASTIFMDTPINKDKITSFEASLNARYDTKRGIWYATQGVYQAFPIFGDESKYFKYTGSLVRLHDFGHGIVGQLKGYYQIAPSHVIPYIDQFQAGGLATIRGYSEGLLIGNSGYIISTELMFPIAPQNITVKKKSEKKKIPFIGSFVKGIAFVDHAGIYPYKGSGAGSQSYNSDDYMLSMGLGLRISLPGDASARLYWGCPLWRNSHETHYKSPRFSFEITLTPDIDKILAHRKTVIKQQKKDTL